MTTLIPEQYRDLIDGPLVVTLTTLMPDGRPQSTIVWCNSDDQHILVNTAVGRQKPKNIARDPRVTIMAIDTTRPFRRMEIRGVVVESTEEGAVDHINQLAALYTGNNSYYGGFTPADLAQKETRIIHKIKPEHIVAES
jgi:PPOX class probable F420-dependent enzyme